MGTGTNLELRKEEHELEKATFELEQRRAGALAKSAFFPKDLQGDIASAVIIYDLANRMGVSVMEVAQSVFIIYGRPSFSTSYLVARLNTSGLIHGVLHVKLSDDKQSAYAYATDAATGKQVIGMVVTMGMAKAEGWIDKKGSKWVNMPELMLRKRAQAFFIREFYPQVTFGMYSQEELIDVEPIGTSQATETLAKSINKVAAPGAKEETVDINAPKQKAEKEAMQKPGVEIDVADPDTGEIIIDVPDTELEEK